MKRETGEIDSILKNVDTGAFLAKRVIVTGGAGFLGSWICEALLSAGAHVTCLDNLSSGRERNISHLKKDPAFSFIMWDVSEPPRLEEKPDFIFHLASRASPLEFANHPLEILRSNTLGTMNMLEVARKSGAVLLFSSTSEVYGDAAVFPTPETYQGNVNPVGIRGCYDEAKRAGEAFCMAYFRQHGTDTRVVRIFNTYGPRMRGDGIYGRVVPRFITQARNGRPFSIFGDGQQTRSFCFVTDQIRALLLFISHPGLAGEVVNIGNPEEVTILQLAKLISEICQSEEQYEYHPRPPDDPIRRLPDISKAKELLGWKPEISLKEGLERMVADCMKRDL